MLLRVFLEKKTGYMKKVKPLLVFGFGLILVVVFSIGRVMMM